MSRGITSISAKPYEREGRTARDVMAPDERPQKTGTGCYVMRVRPGATTMCTTIRV